MTRRPSPRMPRRPKRDRAAGTTDALPANDRFAPHPDESIDVVYVMGRAGELVGSRPKEVVGVMLASLALTGLAALAISLAGAFDEEPSGLVMLVVLATWSLGLLIQTPLVGAAIEVHTEHRGLALQFLRRGLDRFGRLFAASFAVVAIVGVVGTVAAFLQVGLVTVTNALPLGFVGVMVIFGGSLTLLLLALRIITAFSLVVPIILVENLAPGAALGRSWEIGWRNGTPIFLALLIPALLAQFVLFLAGFMPTFISIPAAIILGLGLALYNSAVVPVSYVVIREYVEGLDPAQLLGRLGRR